MIEKKHRRLEVVDSLRAISIVAVILFHSFPAALSGGFIGVDIFFLISGFVIWMKYGDRLVAGDVTLKSFFIFRVRRLLPAYAVFLVLTTLVALAILPPFQLSDYANVLFGNAFYLQNVILFLQGDYFVSGYERPLLHTWSLAVEEQYYLLFPLLILLARWRIWLAMSALMAISILSIASGAIINDFSQRAAFFLIPFRIWEFAFGTFAAIGYKYLQSHPVRPLKGNAAGHIGTAAIIFSIALFDSSEPFPDLQAGLALSGATLVCLFQDNISGPLRRCMTAPLTQHFAKISYSWYLWHWPFTSFIFIESGQKPSFRETMAILIAGYALGCLSYMFVENSDEIRERLSAAKYAFRSIVAFTLLCVGAAYFVTFTEGGLFRYGPDERPFVAAQNDVPSERCGFVRRLQMPRSSVCQWTSSKSGKSILLVGDSHSNMIRPILLEIAKEKDVALYVSTNICRPMEFGRAFCENGYIDRLKRDVELLRIDRLLIAARWPADFTSNDYAYIFDKFSNFVSEKVFVLKSIPESKNFEPTVENARLSHKENRGISYANYEFDDYMRKFHVQMESLEDITMRNPKIKIVDTPSVLCDRKYCIFSVAGRPIYSDDDHLNYAGGSLLKPLLSKAFE